MTRYEWVEDKVHRRKMAREAARSVLPNATEVKIVVSGSHETSSAALVRAASNSSVDCSASAYDDATKSRLK